VKGGVSVIVNGEEMKLKDGISIEEMLNKLSIDPHKVVVEVDFEIINKNEFLTKKLSSDSKVEIIRFVGGG
jgi:sulfur carrier protein